MPNAQPQLIPVAILGPTGYTGLELIEIILRHPSMRVAYLGSAREKLPRIEAEFPRLAGRLGAEGQCRAIDHDAIARECKLAFLCLPHEAAMAHVPELLKRGVKCVDLSAAYRIKDAAVYAQAYGHPHTDPKGLERAVYGLTEFTRAEVAKADLVANPGCYPTAAAMALLPLLKAGVIDPASIIINAASGVSGAGRDAKPHLHLVEAGENYSAYGIGMHRHQPEINQTLNSLSLMGAGVGGRVGVASVSEAKALFVPHLLPIERGILETIYATPTDSDAHVDTTRVQDVLRDAYAGERFIVVRDEAPQLRDVQRTNRVHVNGRVVGGRVVLVAAIDNLVKGASGQAVQNANVMLGLEEGAGLV
ncbi:MAG: N-acetyl-gamma-glutamyl-phosphate reductase [Phycisphaerales bacterium]